MENLARCLEQQSQQESKAVREVYASVTSENLCVAQRFVGFRHGVPRAPLERLRPEKNGGIGFRVSCTVHPSEVRLASYL